MLLAGNGERSKDTASPTAVISCQPMPSSSQRFSNRTCAFELRSTFARSSHSSLPIVRWIWPGRSVYPLATTCKGTRASPTDSRTAPAIAAH